MNVIYSLQFDGNSPYDDTAPVDVFQPGKVTYDTSAVFSVSRFAAVNPDKLTAMPKVVEKSLTRETKEFLPVNEVFHRDFDLLEVIKNIKLRQIKRIVAIDLTRMLHHN
jgi:hypothetical protein